MRIRTSFSLISLLLSQSNCKKDNIVLENNFTKDIVLISNGGGLSASLTKGLVAYYPLNGNLKDLSQNSLNLTAIGAPQFVPDRFGKKNSAISLNGTTDYLYHARDSALLLNGNILITDYINIPKTNRESLEIGLSIKLLNNKKFKILHNASVAINIIQILLLIYLTFLLLDF